MDLLDPPESHADPTRLTVDASAIKIVINEIKVTILNICLIKILF